MAKKPEDFNLPNSAIAKIIKEALPSGVKVSDGAKAALSKAASVFILYTTSCANTYALRNNRKTLIGSDIIEAMEDLEFHELVGSLETILQGFHEEKSKKQVSKKKPKKDSAGDEEMGGMEDESSDDSSDVCYAFK